MVTQFEVQTSGKGLVEITRRVAEVVGDSAVSNGLATIFIRHTSASLTIQENADPAVQRDLQSWMERKVPEDDPDYTHTAEGPDDMPSHIRAALTDCSLGVPIIDGRMALGTWQGIYVWEHRSRPHTRKIVVHVSE